MLSEIRMMGRVPFPAHTNERIYMLPFERELPKPYARWQPTVDAMLQGLNGEGRCYLMVDQGTVAPGKSHRRPGRHVDGNWLEDLRCHGQPEPRHGQGGGRWNNPGWGRHYTPETIVLAADVLGAVAYAGEFEADIGPGGEVDADVSSLTRVPLIPGIAWAGNVTMLHESMPLPERVARTVVRINAPGHSLPAQGFKP